MVSPNTQTSTTLVALLPHESFWVERLTHLNPLAAPFLRRSVSEPGLQTRIQRCKFSTAITQWLAHKSIQHELGILLTAVFGAFLARLAGQLTFDLEFRDAYLAAETDGLEDLAATHVPLRFHVHSDQPFSVLLAELQLELDQTREHITYPHDVVTRYAELHTLAELEGKNRCPVAVELVPDIPDVATLADNKPRHELTLLVAGGEACLLFDAAIFSAETSAAVAVQLDVFLTNLAADESRPIARIPLVSHSDRERLLNTWNQTAAPFPHDACVHDLFEAQVDRTPDAIAVTFRDTHMTFRELNDKANQLAHYLRNLGVGPEVLVGLCLKRSLEMMVGLLGILKAGAAYVPLDPTYPRERLAYMLHDADAPVLLVQESLRESLPANGSILVSLDSQWDEIAQQSTANPEHQATAENLAYVIYTSGSTGRPKGTMIIHRGFVNYLTWCIGAYRVAEGRGAPVHSSISFDLTITGLFAPLLVGRSVYLVPEDLEAQGLVDALQREKDFSLVKITPVHLELLTQQLAPAETAGRTRWFIIGGENLTWESIRFWQENSPDTVLINEYGPTETVVGCCVYQVPRNERRSGSVPIGRPIANTQLYLLDSAMELVPIGTPGELYIGGAGVARGYLNQPEATAEKFLPDPFSSLPGAKLYRTGDLARYLPDGNLEFLGRIDHQVKIRGYRVELGEIESAIRRYPAVRECVAILREESNGEKRLIAYVIPHRGETIATPALRTFLKQWLPRYMLPAAVVFVEAFALSPNGKLDRKLLPEPADFSPVALVDIVSPRTSLEESVAKIWCQHLGLKQVGVHENFFELGGHSLMAVRVVNELNRTLGMPLNVLRIYQNPTIERLAASIATPAAPAPHRSSVIQLQPAANGCTKPPIYFIYAGPEEFRVAESLRHAGVDRAIFAIEVPWCSAWREAVANNRLECFPCLEELAALFAAELSAHAAGPCVLAGYSFAGLIAFEVAHQLQSQGGAVENILLFDSVAKYPSKRRQWLYNWRQDWKESPKIFSSRLPKAAVARTRSLWRLTRWSLQAAQQKIFARFHHPPNHAPYIMDPGILTSLRDQDGEALHWGLVERLYTKARMCYTLQPLATKATLFRAVPNDPSITRPLDETLGWRDMFQQGLTVLPVQGTHHSIIQLPDLAGLSTHIRTSLGD